jgi:hypothetical protein
MAAMDRKVTYLTNRKTLAAKEHGYCVMVKMIQKWCRENDEEQGKDLGDGGVFAPITVVPPSDAFLVWGERNTRRDGGVLFCLSLGLGNYAECYYIC